MKFKEKVLMVSDGEGGRRSARMYSIDGVEWAMDKARLRRRLIGANNLHAGYIGRRLGLAPADHLMLTHDHDEALPHFDCEACRAEGVPEVKSKAVAKRVGGAPVPIHHSGVIHGGLRIRKKPARLKGRRPTPKAWPVGW